jgi:hypothetical protein
MTKIRQSISRLTAAFILIVSGLAAMVATPRVANADTEYCCYHYGNSYSETGYWNQQDSDCNEDGYCGSYSVTCSFTVDEGLQHDYNEWYTPGPESTGYWNPDEYEWSYTKVEYGLAGTSCPFQVGEVNNGGRVLEYYHQRGGQQQAWGPFHPDHDAWSGFCCVNGNEDAYAYGLQGVNERYWDPLATGWVQALAEDANGGVLGNWGAYYFDWGN